MNQPSPIPLPEASLPLLSLLFQRFRGADGKLIRGAQSRIAEHLGVTYGTVSQWFSKGSKCHKKHHGQIAQLILSNADFSARKTGPKAEA
jgi:hypothetical protein